MPILQSADEKLSAAARFFNGKRLTLAREFRQLNKSTLARDLNISPSAVSAWENGKKAPSKGTIAALSLRLAFDPLFFTGDAPITSDEPFFRSLRSLSKTQRKEAEAYSSFALELIDHVERAIEFPELNLPHFSSNENTPASAAKNLRQAWNLQAGPVPHMIRTCENHGIFSLFAPPTSQKVDAYSTSNGSRALIVLNPAKHNYYRQRFDVAHELGHLVMHSDESPGNVVEQQAHAFAAEFLMPEAEIASALPSSTGSKAWRALGELKEYWGVSIAALLYRARALSIMSDVSYRNAMMYMSRNGWRQNEPGRVGTLETPSLLPQAVDMLATAGTQLASAKSDLCFPDELFETLTSRTPRPVPDTDL